jgi:hypothetical protein
MPGIPELFKYWWKQIAGVVILSVLAVGIITFLKPKEYLSISTAVPASSYSADRSSVFNENIQALYSTLGTADDLDRIVGTGELDTVYLAVADAIDLTGHYKTGQNNTARAKAATCLKGNTRVVKSGYGELKVKVWDKNTHMAAQLSNAVMEKLNNIHQAVQNETNVAALQNMKNARTRTSAELDSLVETIRYDSTNALIRSTIITEEMKRSRSIRRNSLYAQLEQYENLVNQYQLMVDSKNPVLVVVDKARAAGSPDRPKTMYIIFATAVLAFVFSLLLALVLHRSKNVAS